MKMDADIFGEGFHTGLRKGSDTQYSSMLWNLIHMIDPKVWGYFCEIVVKNLHKNKLPLSQKKLEEAIKDWDYYQCAEKLMPDRHGHAAEFNLYRLHACTFHSALQLIDKETTEDLYYWFKHNIFQ